MRIKDPHNYMVTALGSSEKWPYFNSQKSSQIPTQHIQIPSNSSQGAIIEIHHFMGSDSKCTRQEDLGYSCVVLARSPSCLCVCCVASEFLGFRSARV